MVVLSPSSKFQKAEGKAKCRTDTCYRHSGEAWLLLGGPRRCGRSMQGVQALGASAPQPTNQNQQTPHWRTWHNHEADVQQRRQLVQHMYVRLRSVLLKLASLVGMAELTILLLMAQLPAVQPAAEGRDARTMDGEDARLCPEAGGGFV